MSLDLDLTKQQPVVVRYKRIIVIQAVAECSPLVNGATVQSLSLQ